MTFTNEYVSEADYEKYDRVGICGEHNLVHRGHMHSREWTINRERDVLLILVWSHPESRFRGFAFYWKGEWMFFENAITGADDNRTDGSCWVGYLIKGFSLPKHMEANRKEIIADLTQALGDYCGIGVPSTSEKCSATVEFIKE